MNLILPIFLFKKITSFRDKYSLLFQIIWFFLKKLLFLQKLSDDIFIKMRQKKIDEGNFRFWIFKDLFNKNNPS